MQIIVKRVQLSKTSNYITMKSLKFILGLVIILSLGSFKQSSDWTLYKTEKGVQFFYKVTDCDDEKNGLYQNFVILKVVNTTNFDVKVSFKKEVWYNNECRTCDDYGNEFTTNLSLLSNSEKVGNCKGELSIFSEFKDKPDVSKLSKFELVDIKVNRKLQ